MSRLSDAALARLKDANPVEQVAERLGVKLRRSGRSFVGACPICGGNPKTNGRFEVNTQTDSWVCAVCPDGGDAIRLVMKACGLDFRGAVDWLGGADEGAEDTAPVAEARGRRAHEAGAAIDAAPDDYRNRRDLADAWRRGWSKACNAEADAAKFREQERARCWQIWQAARPDAPEIARYYAIRGCLPPPSRCIRFSPEQALYPEDRRSKEERAAGVRLEPLHVGPAMVSAVIGPHGRFAGVHRTWLDFDDPDGKARVPDPETGEMLPAKKARGSTKGGHIEVVPCAHPNELHLGEGQEELVSTWSALIAEGRDVSRIAFWSAIDLGNLGGKAVDTVPHPTERNRNGQPKRVPGPEPDLTARSIIVPPSVDLLFIYRDGDSEPFLTECAVRRCALRHRRPGLAIHIVSAGQGLDFNRLLRGAA